MHLAERFSNLLDAHVDKIRRRGSRVTGRCPFHTDRTPSFSANLDIGGWLCFGCGAHGNVRDFARRVGAEWAIPHRARSPEEHRRREVADQRAQAERAAVVQVTAQFTQWRDATLTALANEYRAVLDEIDALSIAYPKIAHGTPHQFDDLTVWTEDRLARLYHRLPVLENDLDILTYDRHAKECTAWWQEETFHV